MVTAKKVFDSFWKNHARQAEKACERSCSKAGGVVVIRKHKTNSRKSLRKGKGARRTTRSRHGHKAKAHGKRVVPGTVKIGNTTVVPGQPIKPLVLPKKVVTPAVKNVLKQIKGQRSRNVKVDSAAYRAIGKTIQLKANT